MLARLDELEKEEELAAKSGNDNEINEQTTEEVGDVSYQRHVDSKHHNSEDLHKINTATNQMPQPTTAVDKGRDGLAAAKDIVLREKYQRRQQQRTSHVGGDANIIPAFGELRREELLQLPGNPKLQRLPALLSPYNKQTAPSER
ncbi:hypothetical protein PIB30_024858 [Stylosanthes scabra]|uniref:Uncharacterized protein n=1 Tax=Stylosanthes scabra TaxID=79078 RepID=A0ABU6Z9B9_9FABA|nr:hypothetical protein [Stylosanthes scabra]